MPQELDPIQTAYNQWMAAFQIYKEELSKAVGGAKFDSVKLKELSDIAKERNEEFLTAIQQRQSQM